MSVASQALNEIKNNPADVHVVASAAGSTNMAIADRRFIVTPFSSGTHTIEMVHATLLPGVKVTVHTDSDATGTVTIGFKIDEGADIVITGVGEVMLISDGRRWYSIEALTGE